MLTKKRLGLITIVMAIVYFFLMCFLPESIVGDRANNKIMFATKIAFLSITAATTTALIFIFIFKRNLVKGHWAAFTRYKYLLQLLVRREFVSRYRKSMLGILWSLLNPLMTMLVLTLVFSYIFARNIENFPVYLLSGTIIFGFFSESTNHAMNAIIASENIMKKVYVPKYIFPLARVTSSLVNLLFSFLAFLLVFIITQHEFYWTMLLIPIPIFYTFVFSLGVSMLLSSMMVFFRDLSYLYHVFLTLFHYLTPVFYPIEALPEQMIPLMGFNPLYHFIEYFRMLALYGTIPSLWENAVCIGFSIASLCFGTYVFISKRDQYILFI